VLRDCAVCHRLSADGPERSAPSLWNLAGSAQASAPWFGYSPALARQRGVWTADAIDAYLADPLGHLPGTSKSLSRLRDADQRRRVLDALHALTP
jgi:cytochrome c